MNARLLVGRNIARIRGQKGLSQTQLASRIDAKMTVDQSYLSKLERGSKNVSIDTLEVIAEALQVRLADLVAEK